MYVHDEYTHSIPYAQNVHSVMYMTCVQVGVSMCKQTFVHESVYTSEFFLELTDLGSETKLVYRLLYI